MPRTMMGRAIGPLAAPWPRPGRALAALWNGALCCRKAA